MWVSPQQDFPQRGSAALADRYDEELRLSVVEVEVEAPLQEVAVYDRRNLARQRPDAVCRGAWW